MCHQLTLEIPHVWVKISATYNIKFILL
jgi:hypothetical protein